MSQESGLFRYQTDIPDFKVLLLNIYWTGLYELQKHQYQKKFIFPTLKEILIDGNSTDLCKVIFFLNVLKHYTVDS